MLTWNFLNKLIPVTRNLRFQQFCASVTSSDYDPFLQTLRRFIVSKHAEFSEFDDVMSTADIIDLFRLLDSCPDELANYPRQIIERLSPEQIHNCFLPFTEGDHREAKQEAMPFNAKWFGLLKLQITPAYRMKMLYQIGKETRDQIAPLLISASECEEYVRHDRYADSGIVTEKRWGMRPLYAMFERGEPFNSALRSFFNSSTHADNIAFLKAIFARNESAARKVELLRKFLSLLAPQKHVAFINALIAANNPIKNSPFAGVINDVLLGKIIIQVGDEKPVPFEPHALHQYYVKLLEGENYQLPYKTVDDIAKLYELADCFQKPVFDLPFDLQLRAFDSVFGRMEDFAVQIINELDVLKKPTKSTEVFEDAWYHFLKKDWINPGRTPAEELRSVIDKFKEVVATSQLLTDIDGVILHLERMHTLCVAKENNRPLFQYEKLKKANLQQEIKLEEEKREHAMEKPRHVVTPREYQKLSTTQPEDETEQLTIASPRALQTFFETSRIRTVSASDRPVAAHQVFRSPM